MAIPTIEQQKTIKGLIGMHGMYDEIISEKTESPAEVRVQFVIWWPKVTGPDSERKFFAIGPDGHRAAFDNYA